jgi:hypothetical protein
MKRAIRADAERFSIINDTGALAISIGRTCQALDVEGVVRSTFDVDHPIHLLVGSPYLTIGCAGMIYILDPRGTLVGYLFPVGYESSLPSSISDSATTTQVAVAVDNVILIFDLNKKLDAALVALLEGHESRVARCQFLTHSGYEHLIVTCGDDNRYIVWDLTKRCMVFESPYESSEPIRGIATFESNHLFAMAFDNGFGMVYDASPIPDARPSVKFVRSINLAKVELEVDEEEAEPTIVISKKRPPKPLPKPDFSGEPSPSIIASGVASMHARQYMVCATASSVVALNIATFERTVVRQFNQPASAACFSELIVASQSSSAIYVKRLAIGVVPRIGLSLFPDSDPPDGSCLNVIIDLKTKQPTPIATLHKVVCSSGYNQRPPPLARSASPGRRRRAARRNLRAIRPLSPRSQSPRRPRALLPLTTPHSSLPLCLQTGSGPSVPTITGRLSLSKQTLRRPTSGTASP